MKFKQNLSLLFWLYRGKASKDGKAPIYVRITIDGTDTDISLGKKIHPDFWNSDAKLVTATPAEAKMINLKIVQAQAEIEKPPMSGRIPAKRSTHALVLKYLTSHLLQKTKAKDGQQSYFDADIALDYTDAGPECLGTEHFQATSYFPQHS